MAKSSSDFERFLYANFPEDYRRATVDDVPDDVIYAILSRHEARYKIWQRIPEWVKTKYRDKLPSEVLNGNMPVKEFVKEEEKAVKEEEKSTAALLEYGALLLAAGYAAETAAVLVKNRSKREELLQQAEDGKLSDAQRALWRETRESDKKAITDDWRTRQPEKYLLHLIKEIDRAKKRGAKALSEQEKAAMEMKAGSFERELQQVAGRFKTKEDRERLKAYLQEMPQQAALKHLSPDMFSRFSEIAKSCGIKIKPARAEGEKAQEVTRESLADDLKQNFLRRKSIEGILSQKYLYQNESFKRIYADDVLDMGQNGGLDKVIALRNKNNSKQRA